MMDRVGARFHLPAICGMKRIVARKEKTHGSLLL
jgi:hypothetical protein